MRKIISIFALVVLVHFAYGQLFKTSLKVRILDDLGNNVKGAEVTLFKNAEDYNKEENAVAGPLTTDSRGFVKFEDLEPVEYYIMAQKEDMNNFGMGEKVEPLEENKLNKITIIISE